MLEGQELAETILVPVRLSLAELCFAFPGSRLFCGMAGVHGLRSGYSRSRRSVNNAQTQITDLCGRWVQIDTIDGIAAAAEAVNKPDAGSPAATQHPIASTA